MLRRPTARSPLHSDKKSERAKDMHLLKRLTAVLRSREVEPGRREGGGRYEKRESERECG